MVKIKGILQSLQKKPGQRVPIMRTFKGLSFNQSLKNGPLLFFIHLRFFLLRGGGIKSLDLFNKVGCFEPSFRAYFCCFSLSSLNLHFQISTTWRSCHSSKVSMRTLRSSPWPNLEPQTSSMRSALRPSFNLFHQLNQLSWGRNASRNSAVPGIDAAT